jgi:hypothetical protein
MKTLIFTILLLLIIAPLSPATAKAEEMPEADGKSLWHYITKSSPYTKWEHWPGLPEMYRGKPPHGAYLEVFANPIAIKAAKAGTIMPHGAIIVKENIAKDKTTVVAITPMFKIKNFNPEGDDWFWAKYKPDGSIGAEGKVESCIKCHKVAKATNWIFNIAK